MFLPSARHRERSYVRQKQQLSRGQRSADTFHHLQREKRAQRRLVISTREKPFVPLREGVEFITHIPRSDCHLFWVHRYPFSRIRERNGKDVLPHHH